MSRREICAASAEGDLRTNRVTADVVVAKQKVVSEGKELKCQKIYLCTHSAEIFHKYTDKMGQSVGAVTKEKEEAELRRCLKR